MCEREIIYNILVEFCIPIKLVRLIKMCLSETYSTVRVRRHLSDMFPVWTRCETRTCFIAIIIQLRLYNMSLGGFRQTRRA